MSCAAPCNCDQPYIGPPLTNLCGGGSFITFMGILNTLITNQCEVSDICGRNKPRTTPDDEYDFIVIGGGSGGATAAGRLAEVSHWKILLLEAGNDEPPGSQVPSMFENYIGSDIDWNYKTEPEPVACQGEPEERCTWPRGKVLGGTSVIHGMMYMRGLPKDFDTWAEMGNKGWAYKDVEPIFRRMEDNKDIGSLVSPRYHGKSGSMTVARFGYQPEPIYDLLQAAEELGYPVRNELNGNEKNGFAIAQANIRNQVRLSSARQYVRPQRNNPNFHLMLNSTATRVIIQNKTAIGVEFAYRNMTYTVRAKKEVIIAGGAIGSPQILLLSGVGPKDELKHVGINPVHDLPGVGKNLMNHVSFKLNYYAQNVPPYNDLNWAEVVDYLLYKKGTLTSTGLSQLTGRINSKYNKEKDNPDLQFFFNGYKAECADDGKIGSLTEDEEGKRITIAPVVLRPKSRGYLKLKSRDPFAYPEIHANYLTEEDDQLVLLDAIRIGERLANTSIMRKKYNLKLKDEYGKCTEHEFDTDDFWICAMKYKTAPENHQASSCMMGPNSNPLAVVDEKLKVHGIDRLRVMDASVMPFQVSANPHANVVLVAEKGVKHVKEKWLRNFQ